MRVVLRALSQPLFRHRIFHVVITAGLAVAGLIQAKPTATIHVDAQPQPNMALVAPTSPDTTASPLATTTTPAKSTTPSAKGKVKGIATIAAAQAKWGIAAGSSLTGLSLAELNRQLDGMKNLGVGWVRYDVDWSNIQPGHGGAYRWVETDRVTSAVLAHGLKPLGILDGTPPWAGISECSGGQFCQPADPAAFATFSAAAADHYKAQITNWEIWNEPNNAGFWLPAANPTAYTKLLIASAAAIRRVQPNAFIITGGLSPASTDGQNMAPADFLAAIYAGGGRASFNAVADHPYTFPEFPSLNTDHAWTQMVRDVRRVMVANGDAAKTIWATEFGAPTNGPNRYQVTEAAQAAMVTETVNLWRKYPWSGPLFWYTYKDPGTTRDTNENFFGLIRADNSPKPAFTTLQAAIAP